MTWSSIFVITNSTGERRFTIIDTKLFVPIVTLSTQDSAKLLQQLKSFENEDDRTHSNYYLPKVEIKDYNVMIDGKNFFDQPIKANLKHLKILEKLQLVKEMIAQPGVY